MLLHVRVLGTCCALLSFELLQVLAWGQQLFCLFLGTGAYRSITKGGHAKHQQSLAWVRQPVPNWLAVAPCDAQGVASRRAYQYACAGLHALATTIAVYRHGISKCMAMHVLPSVNKANVVVPAGISATLSYVMYQRYASSGKIMPAGFTAMIR